MGQDISTEFRRTVPGSLPVEISSAMDACLNKLDQVGTGFSISADDAPRPAVRVALEARITRLTDALAPAGKRYAATRLGEMSFMKKRPRSQAEADLAFGKTVDGLADLPMFAIDAAATDFERGAAGEGWFPDLADIRPHALAKMQAAAAERRKIDKLLHATVRPAASNPARKAELVRVARDAASAISINGLEAERNRRQAETDFRQKERRDAEEARIAADKRALTDLEAKVARGDPDNRPLPPLSDHLRHSLNLPDTDRSVM